MFQHLNLHPATTSADVTHAVGASSALRLRIRVHASALKCNSNSIRPQESKLRLTNIFAFSVGNETLQAEAKRRPSKEQPGQTPQSRSRHRSQLAGAPSENDWLRQFHAAQHAELSTAVATTRQRATGYASHATANDRTRVPGNYCSYSLGALQIHLWILELLSDAHSGSFKIFVHLERMRRITQHSVLVIQDLRTAAAELHTLPQHGLWLLDA